MENTVPNTKMEHLALLEENIRKAMRRRNLDPREDRDAVRALIGECLDEYEQKRTRVSLPDVGERSVVIQRLHDEICGFGVIQPFLDDESVEEIWINSPDEIFIARNGESELTGLHLSPRAINSLLERMLKPSGRRLDLSSPFVDASLPDGSRLHAVIPDITRRHTSINIRKFVVRARRLPDRGPHELPERRRGVPAARGGGERHEYPRLGCNPVGQDHDAQLPICIDSAAGTRGHL